MKNELLIAANENPNKEWHWVDWWCNFLNAVEEGLVNDPYHSLSGDQRMKLISDELRVHSAIIDFKNKILIFDTEEDKLEFLLAWS